MKDYNFDSEKEQGIEESYNKPLEETNEGN